MKRSSLELGAGIVSIISILLVIGEVIGYQSSDSAKIATYLAMAIIALLAPKLASISVGKDGLVASLAEKMEENGQRIERTKNVAIELDEQLNQKISQIFEELRQLRQFSSSFENGFEAQSISTTDKPELPTVTVVNDPQKQRFGGQETNDGLLIAAIVEKSDVGGDWQKVSITVRATKDTPLKGVVDFFLHDSFQPNQYRIPVTKGEAKLVIRAWGAFTVGALAGEKQVPLELDLATSPNVVAPMNWKSR
ncbi:pYEATS domain-containing protein [Rhizobium wenxiniae]|uniref:pYEATS domain-containing protein n=1 Tax=Rhizobium wenxiniae TaxID=1737357 RepID=UPI003C1D7AAC